MRDRAADRELRQSVVLATTLSVWTSSTSPPGGAVGWFVVVRNDGREPVAVTAVEAVGDRLRIRTDDDGERLVAPGEEVGFPVSVGLTCAAHDATPLLVDVDVRRQAGVHGAPGPAGSRSLRAGTAGEELSPGPSLVTAG